MDRRPGMKFALSSIGSLKTVWYSHAEGSKMRIGGIFAMTLTSSSVGLRHGAQQPKSCSDRVFTALDRAIQFDCLRGNSAAVCASLGDRRRTDIAIKYRYSQREFDCGH